MTSDSFSTPAATSGIIDNPSQRRTILITVCLALMAVIASVSGLNVAQADLAIEFNASQSDVLWFINIYTLSLSALLLPLGALGDRWGRKPMLLTGLGVFGVASLLAAIATSSEVMLLARFLSGVGAAMIMPVTLAVITSTFPAEERAKAIGIWTGVAGGGGILGMYLSAVLVDLASWRWLFALPVILVVLAGWQTLRSIPKLHPGFSLYVDREVHDVPIEITGPCQIRTGDHGVVEIANRFQSRVSPNPLLTLD